jgi:Asp-tRNA(Asn)/Glu-tRNA(Gln) amidotransferase A subunit family amidase
MPSSMKLDSGREWLQGALTTDGEIVGRPLVELAQAVRTGRLSAEVVVRTYLARIAEINPTINAIVTEAPDALASAAAVDRTIERGEDPGPLCGIPFTVKDSIATAGVRTTAGSRMLEHWVPSESAPAVQRLQRAGAVLLGKTNTPEFALDLHTDNALFGPTLNPRDVSLTPGGSSGGESAALASGLSALGIGTDFGASIRWPAQCTGVVGLRPTVGRIPLTGVLPYLTTGPSDQHSFLTETQVVAPIARRVLDLWLALKVMNGPDGSDELVSSHALLDPRSVDPTTLGCAWFETDGSYPARDDVGRVVASAADHLASSSLDVVRRRPSAIAEAEEIYRVLRTADDARWMSDLPTDQGGRRPPFIEAAMEASLRLAPGRRRAATQRRAVLADELSTFMQEFPILLTAVSSIPAFPVGETEHRVHGTPIPGHGIVAPCRAIGLFGLPAVSVPFGLAADGAGISVQVVGRPFAEHQVLAVASILESQFHQTS